jgi:hypothetical protein
MNTYSETTSRAVSNVTWTPRIICLLATAGGIFMLQLACAQFPLPFHEPFPTNYTNGGTAIAVPQDGGNFPALNLSIGASGTRWTLGGGQGGGSPQLVGGPASLSVPGLATNLAPSTGLYLRTNFPTANRSRGVLFSSQVQTGNVYVSFLLNVEQAPPPDTTRVFALLSSLTGGNPGSGTTAVGIGVDSSTSLFLAQGSIDTPTVTMPAPLAPGTHLVVARYRLDFGFPDEVALWVDPAALATPEESVPAPDISAATGAFQPIQSFYILHPQTGTATNPISIFMDEIRVGTTWASVTPTGAVCTAATLITEPVDASATEGTTAAFTIVADGTLPVFQWQVSTNSGTTWNNVTGGTGGTTTSFTTPPLTVAHNGNQYRVIVSVTCDNMSVTSSPVNLTVTAALPTPLGVVVDDRFQDFSRNDPPVGISNSVWFASSGVNFDASSGTNVTGIPSGGSALWLSYYTEDPASPVQLAVGRTLKATLVFAPNNVVSNGGNSMRFGVYNYADGGTRLVSDGSGGSAGNGGNVKGYMFVINFGTNFSSNTPFQWYGRNNLPSGNLMGTTGDYMSLGTGPTGLPLQGTTAFQSDVEYTVELSVTRTSFTSAQLVGRISGGGLNLTHTVTDNTFGYSRFDAFGIRPNSLATTASSFSFTQFRVEVLEAVIPVNPFDITEVRLIAPGVVRLAWESVNGTTYQIQSRDSLTAGGWITNATVQAIDTTAAYTNSPIAPDVTQRYYRVVAQ